MHSDSFKKYRKTKAQYDKLYSEYETAKNATGLFAERKAQKALDAVNDYHELYRPQLAMWGSADKYLRNVLQERFDPKKLPPITIWREELAAKSAEKNAQYQNYLKLKGETYKVEKIRASVKEIMQTEAPRRTPQKSKDIEL